MATTAIATIGRAAGPPWAADQRHAAAAACADGTAEVRGDLRKALTLLSSRNESAVLWSGEAVLHEVHPPDRWSVTVLLAA